MNGGGGYLLGGLGRLLSEGLMVNLTSYQHHFSLNISQNGLKMEKKEGTCGSIKKEEAEIQHLSETFQNFI